MANPFVSFIVPTTGRDSLAPALRSIRDQTDRDLEAIVVADGFQMEVRWMPDDRFGVAQPEESIRSAGISRNIGIAIAEGQWIGFLDDDDIITPNYVHFLKDHASAEPDADVVVFRMNHPTRGILPHPREPKIAHGEVGISFAVKSKWFKTGTVEFIDENLKNPGVDGNEDITLLRDLIVRGARIFLSPMLTYVVRPNVPRAA